MPVKLTCQGPGKPHTFLVPPNRAKTAKYCSKSCAMKARTGARHFNWKGGSYITAQGYRRVKCPDHPAADGGGYVLEHRLVMEQYLGRYLQTDEHVHHIDSDRLNNDLSNLQVMSHREHISHHHKGKHRPRKPADKWAIHYNACVHCGRTDSPHSARGSCHRCYEYRRRHNLPIGEQRND